ncbi:MAG: hypothetical protein K6F92_00235 [Lachnospiraceae bacterium]|nr:hypothetical protein [Lachnospiraceae bacterium]
MKKSSVMWYSAGTIVFALATMVILSIVKRISGQDAGDDFSIAFTLAQTLLTVGYFEIRPFQVTDASGKYSFSDYFTLRSLTTVFMLVCCFGYLLITRKSYDIWPLMIALCGFKMADSLADIFEGDYQKEEHLDLAGKSMVIRTVVSLVVFFIAMAVTKNPLAGAVCMTAAAFFVVIIVNPLMLRSFGAPAFRFDLKGKWGSIFKECFLIALSSFLYAYMIASSKYAVDYFDDSFNYIFYVLFLPSWAINLVSTMIFKPVLTTLTEHYAKRRYKNFAKLTALLMIAVGLLTIVCLLGAWLLGIPVLSLLFDVDLAPYKTELLILLLGGGFNAAGILMYYAVLVMRMSRGIFVSYVVTFVVSVFLPFWWMKEFSITGAAWAYAVLMFILLMCFVALFVYRCRKDMKNEG